MAHGERLNNPGATLRGVLHHAAALTLHIMPPGLLSPAGGGRGGGKKASTSFRHHFESFLSCFVSLWDVAAAPLYRLLARI